MPVRVVVPYIAVLNERPVLDPGLLHEPVPCYKFRVFDFAQHNVREVERVPPAFHVAGVGFGSFPGHAVVGKAADL